MYNKLVTTCEKRNYLYCHRKSFSSYILHIVHKKNILGHLKQRKMGNNAAFAIVLFKQINQTFALS